MARSACPMCHETHWRLGRENVLAALAAAPRRLAAAVRRASRARLNRRPAPGEWSAVEVLAARATLATFTALRVDQLLAHWAEHDLNHLQRIQSTLATPVHP